MIQRPRKQKPDELNRPINIDQKESGQPVKDSESKEHQEFTSGIVFHEIEAGAVQGKSANGALSITMPPRLVFKLRVMGFEQYAQSFAPVCRHKTWLAFHENCIIWHLPKKNYFFDNLKSVQLISVPRSSYNALKIVNQSDATFIFAFMNFEECGLMSRIRGHLRNLSFIQEFQEITGEIPSIISETLWHWSYHENTESDNEIKRESDATA